MNEQVEIQADNMIAVLRASVMARWTLRRSSRLPWTAHCAVCPRPTMNW